MAPLIWFGFPYFRLNSETMTKPHDRTLWIVLKTSQALYLDCSRAEAKTISGHCSCCLQVWSLEELNFLYKTWVCVPHKCMVLFIPQPCKQNPGPYSPELSPCRVPPHQEGEILHAETWVAIWDHSRVKPIRELTEVALFVNLQGNGQVLEMEEGFLCLESQEGYEYVPIVWRNTFPENPHVSSRLSYWLTSWISFHIVCCLCVVTQQILLLQTHMSSSLHVPAPFNRRELITASSTGFTLPWCLPTLVSLKRAQWKTLPLHSWLLKLLFSSCVSVWLLFSVLHCWSIWQRKWHWCSC